MRRPVRIALVIAALAVFLLISLALARVLGAGGDERVVVVRAIKREAAQRRRGAEVKVLNIEPSTHFAISAGESTKRVAWKVGTALPVVQCVTLRRTGNLASGFEVRVLRVSRPIGLEAGC